ncbi:hypothetical protein EPI10_015748 [Gossypium australe]|uniref:Uncharacterized protein n=1 Tax=Gossypium australe TaxID=47621 RepID=A0A5B6VLR0_9ROSI|nr:hypothetical protein EPI10_015748 [Gossypium australe]
MSTYGVRTKGMRAHGEQGQRTQIDSSAYQVRTPKPIVENVECAPTIEESQQEHANEAISQAMGVPRTTPIVFEYWLEVTERILDYIECTPKQKLK